MRRPRLEDITKHLNFFRYHVIFFSFTPLIFACIFYGANGNATGNANATVGRAKVEFIDSLFLCYSAMTVTGLSTVKWVNSFLNIISVPNLSPATRA